jgi:hypothetical protein
VKAAKTDETLFHPQCLGHSGNPPALETFLQMGLQGPNMKMKSLDLVKAWDPLRNDAYH